MKKNFTKEDIIKKYKTNVTSAYTALSLAGLLGVIYVIRYFITGNFDFHFSLSIPETMLKLGHSETISPVAAYTVTAIFFAVYVLIIVLTLKNEKLLSAGLVLYALDFLCLLIFMFVIMKGVFSSSMYIEVIIHLFTILFLSVGVYSQKKLKEMK